MNTPVKRCSKCNHEFPATTEYFHRDGTKSDGLMPSCKNCRKNVAHDYYVANGDTIREKNQEWKRDNWDKVIKQSQRWAKENPERRKEIERKSKAKRRERDTLLARIWRALNREHSQEYDRDYREKNRARVRENAHNRREQNPEQYRAYGRKRYGLLLDGDGVTADEILQQFDSQVGCCYWCSRHLDNSYHVDHYIPVSRGGKHSPDNIVISCGNCNRRKHNKLPYTEWKPPKPLSPPRT